MLVQASAAPTPGERGLPTDLRDMPRPSTAVRASAARKAVPKLSVMQRMSSRASSVLGFRQSVAAARSSQPSRSSQLSGHSQLSGSSPLRPSSGGPAELTARSRSSNALIDGLKSYREGGSGSMTNRGGMTKRGFEGQLTSLVDPQKASMKRFLGDELRRTSGRQSRVDSAFTGTGRSSAALDSSHSKLGAGGLDPRGSLTGRTSRGLSGKGGALPAHQPGTDLSPLRLSSWMKDDVMETKILAQTNRSNTIRYRI